MLGVILSGCAAAKVSDVISDKARGKGDRRVFAVSSEQAWKISNHILRDWMLSGAIEEHKEAGYLLAGAGGAGSGLDSAQVFIGVWIEPMDKNSTRIIAVSRGRVTNSLSSYEFCVRFDQAVAIIKSGGLLPKTMPPWPSTPE